MGIEGMRVARVVAILVVVVVVLGGAAASAAKPPPVAPGTRYLALGDSVTFGYKEAAVAPPPNYRDQSTFVGYPRMVGRELRMIVSNPACPGETSASFINTSAVSNGCENTLGKPPGYRKLFPLHVNYKGSQLAFALSYLRAHRNVRLVSLMIGANDAFVCQKTTADGCLSSSDQRALFSKISHNVRTILSAIRNKAHYRGQLMIVNYYSLDYNIPLENEVSQQINSAQDSGAKPFGAVIANGYAEFRVGSFRFGYNPCLAGLLTQLGSVGNCGVHPSYAGQALLAKSVVQVVGL
jgi:lysophospholipase L1-like esterase